MERYQKMYYVMIRASEEAIDAICVGDPLQAKEILIAAEQKAEEVYLQTEEKAQK